MNALYALTSREGQEVERRESLLRASGETSGDGLLKNVQVVLSVWALHIRPGKDAWSVNKFLERHDG